MTKKDSIFELHFCKSWDFQRLFSLARVHWLEASPSICCIRQKFPYSIISISGASEKFIKTPDPHYYSVCVFTWRQTTDKPNNIPDNHNSLKDWSLCFRMMAHDTVLLNASDQTISMFLLILWPRMSQEIKQDRFLLCNGCWNKLRLLVKNHVFPTQLSKHLLYKLLIPF